MNRHRDHLAPCDLTDGQLEGIRNVDRIRSLRTQRLALKNDIRALYGTLKKAERADPDRYRAHEAVVKELARVRNLSALSATFACHALLTNCFFPPT
jgi:hypothetical protein